jgi:peroxiredoxin
MRTFRCWIALGAFMVALGTPRAADKGDRAADFEAHALAGGTVRLSSLRGKVVLLDFWASWCEPCKKELPVLAKLASKLRPRGVEIVAVNIDNKRENADAFLKSHGVQLRVLLDPDGKIASKYDPPTMPTSFVIDQQGTIRQVNAGYDDGDEVKIERQLLALLR